SWHKIWIQCTAINASLGLAPPPGTLRVAALNPILANPPHIWSPNRIHDTMPCLDRKMGLQLDY
ncbi:MAG: hypothetical protein ACJ718_02010, partial [Nitrososphaeraceae archaeon]